MNTIPSANVRLLLPIIACVLICSNTFADDGHKHDDSDDNAGKIIALVNGEPISNLSLQRITEQLTAQGQKPDRQNIIDELINLEVLTQEAEKIDLDKRKDVAIALQLQYTQTMANAYLGEFSNNLNIGEDEIRAEYEKQIAAIKASEYKASHIILETEEDALNVIAELDAGGNFAVLAETYSTGPTGVSGGDLGWFQPENMAEEFSAAIALMAKGERSKEPVKTKYGWHIIQLDDLRVAAKPDYSPAIKTGIQNTLLRQAMTSKVEELKNAATIEMK